MMIHPRVPCLNGPIICENLVHIGEGEQSVTGTSVSNSETSKQPTTDPSEPTPSTSQSGPIERNLNDLQKDNDDSMDYDHVERIPIVYSPVNDTIVSEHENEINEQMKQYRSEGNRVEIVNEGTERPYMLIRPYDLDTRGSNNATARGSSNTIKKEDDGSEASDDVVAVMEISGSESDSNGQSKKRTRKEQDADDGPSVSKYTKLKDSDDDNELENTDNELFGLKRKINGDINEDSSVNPEKDVIDLDDSSSDSSANNVAKSNNVTPKVNAATNVKVADSPKPSTSNTGAIDIETDDSSSSDEVGIGLDANKNKKTMKDRTDIGKENDGRGVRSKETFITTDSEGNKEVLTAIPITNLDSDEVSYSVNLQLTLVYIH